MNKRTPIQFASLRLFAPLLGVALLASACGDDDHSEAWDRSLRVGEPLRANGDLLYVNESFEQVFRLRPERSGSEISLSVDRAATGPDPRARALSSDQSTLFVVNEELDDQDASLSVYDLSGQTLSSQTVGLDSPYDRLSVDPEGEFLLLSFTGRGEGFVARNLNELGVVDLRAGLEADAEASFETLSSRPHEIVFAPKFTLGGSEQRLAATLSPSEVTVVDLLADDDTNRLREIPLTLSQADQVRTPTQAIFDVTPDEAMPDTVSLYLLTDTGQDITHVTIQPSILEDAGRKFDIHVNQLAAGQNPVRMKLLELGDPDSQDTRSRLIAIDKNQPRFTMIDVQSGESSTFDLPMTAPAEDLLVYQTSVDGEPETRVLAWSSRSVLVSVIRPESIAISDDTPTLGRSVEAIRLKAPPNRVQLSRVQLDHAGENTAQTGERAIVHHPGLDAGFTVLNLRTNRAVPIQGASLGDIFFGQTYAFGVFRAEPYFGLFDLETGHPRTFKLPKEGQRIYLDADDELLVVEHTDRTGSFTLLNAQNPTPDNARVFNDVFLENLFAQELP